MKIRKQYAVYDRVKVFVILAGVLLFVIGLFLYTLTHNVRNKSSTMETFLTTAMKPIGNTMYIWGGGWADEDGVYGATSTRIGVSPAWEVYADKQDATYDFEQHRWERENGLDCSGYVAWVLYNTFETENDQPGYVMTSTTMAPTYASWRFGKEIVHPDTFFPGDIVSMEGHVWISLGTCADGSVLFVHSSPPGVRLCGTEVPGVKSIAIRLAEEYMLEYYPDWHERYPDCAKPSSYLENVTLMRWNEYTLKGAKEFQKLSGEEMMEYLRAEVSRN